MERRLYRSRVDSKIAGVCGGLGEYFQIDPVIIRIIAFLLIFAKGVGLLAYIVAWIVIPRYPIGADLPPPKPVKRESNWGSLLPGIILVTLGVVFLFDDFFWWFDFEDLFIPIILIAIGVALLLRGKRRDEESESVSVEKIGNSGEVNNVS
jgi:phage shock protein PspC (stress-responsive transcriptional regulator)